MTNQYIEVDIRQLLTGLWQRRVSVIIGSLLIALLTLTASLAWPKRYRATAQLVVTQPVVWTTLNSTFQVMPRLPESKSLADLALADQTLHELSQQFKAASVLDRNTTDEKFKRSLQVKVVGDSLILLTATARSAAQAAEIANTWARKVSDELNALYGIDEVSLGKLKQQLAAAQQAWARTEKDYTDYMAKTRIDALRAELTQKRETMTIYLNRICGIDLLASDIKAMQASVAVKDSADRVPPGVGLGLIELQRRATGPSGNLQLQISGQDLVRGTLTATEAGEVLAKLQTSLEGQRQQLTGEFEPMKAETALNAAKLEEAEYETARLAAQRDLARRTYGELLSQIEAMQITFNHNGPTTKVVGLAQPLDRPVTPRPLAYTIAAFVAGLFLCILAVLSQLWWSAASFSTPPPTRR